MLPTQAADDWPTASLAEVGFAADLGARLDAAVAAGGLGSLHGVVLVRHGRLVLERYYRGAPLRWGFSGMKVVRQPREAVDFNPQTPHDIRSISKSVVGLLYGIALAEGRVPPPEAPLYAQFPALADLTTTERGRITIEHLLTMSTGLDWDERSPYFGTKNNYTLMFFAPDTVRFVLDRPSAAAPGTHWNYDSGGSTLLGTLLVAGAAQSLDAYAEERLFAPLGIEDVRWERDRAGQPITAAGLWLRPRGLAKIGQLVLNRGIWEGKRIVPADWLDRSFEPRVRTGYRQLSAVEYGYQWWVGSTETGGYRQIAGFGYGGQRLYVLPELDLVLVVTAGAYGEKRSGRYADAVLNDVVIPALLQP